MSADELANIASLTEQDILLLLESKDLTPEVLELIEQYQQAQSASDANENTATAVEEAGGNNGHSELNIGDRCAITFSYKDDMVLLPAIIVDIAESTTQVLILTPITRNTIPCSQHFSQSTCKKEPCHYSHGYTLPSEFVVPFEALGTHDADTLLAQLQYGKRVWCKEKDTQDIWQLGNIIDQLHGPRWRVRLKDSKKRIRVDMEHIMPFKSLLDDEDRDNGQQQDMGEWSELDHGDTTDTESVEEDGPVIIASRPDDAFGSWETHTTGFASKMMKKMGYIQGQGLGADGTGRLEPIQARPYSVSSLDQRPGLGLVKKKKPPKKKNKSKESANVEQEKMDMFGLMNSLLEKQQTQEKTSATTAQQRLNKSTDTRQANQTKAKLQSQLETAKHEYTHAAEALRRNQGTSMEAQFRDRLKSATESYHRLNKQMTEIDHHVKRTKQQKDMYTF